MATLVRRSVCAWTSTRHTSTLHIAFSFTDCTHLMMCDPQPFPQLSRKVCCALDADTRQTFSPVFFACVSYHFVFLSLFCLRFFSFFFLGRGGGPRHGRVTVGCDTNFRACKVNHVTLKVATTCATTQHSLSTKNKTKTHCLDARREP